MNGIAISIMKEEEGRGRMLLSLFFSISKVFISTTRTSIHIDQFVYQDDECGSWLRTFLSYTFSSDAGHMDRWGVGGEEIMEEDLFWTWPIEVKWQRIRKNPLKFQLVIYDYSFISYSFVILLHSIGKKLNSQIMTKTQWNDCTFK